MIGLGAVLVGPAAAEMHTSLGLVVRASQGEVVLLEDSHRHALVVDGTTRLEGPLGERVGEIQVGDIVREWCEPLPDGRFVARRIAIRREAWRLAESPEL
jgi:nitrous oxidase accessory protein NosD